MTEPLGPDADIIYERPTPVYQQIAQIITARIARGDWQPDRPIPSEAQMVQEFGVSRATVRNAVKYLAEQGAVYVVPQRGTYVKKQTEQ